MPRGAGAVQWACGRARTSTPARLRYCSLPCSYHLNTATILPFRRHINPLHIVLSQSLRP
ncbi:hypothetical protein E2C01_010330 [Portunus trituberculatus]|uniref:Uncharacterized protein n=1 Tax=Portunus trituberculatus TaxID=210409 RepID=A0A5B7D8C0_PORTR|nr:hypothetical protein [Portunus trituberculatus]